MKIIFSVLLFGHGLIHLMGFAKAFGYGNITQLTKAISKPTGIAWLLAALLCIIAAVQFLGNRDIWWLTATAALLISQYLVFASWHDARYGSIINFIILIAVIIGYCTWNFSNSFQKEVKAVLVQTAVPSADLLTEADIQSLPDAVKKYIRYTGMIGKPKVKNFRLEFSGGIRKDNQAAWMPFTSKQYNFIDASARLFFMSATMKHLPVAGFHSFKNGKAFMDIRLLSLFKVQYQSGREMDIAETVTFFNDMCCMAPATLIDKRIEWQQADSNTAKAVFKNNGISIAARLYFNDRGELINFISDDRFAVSENKAARQIPWSTPLKDYKMINGFKLAGYAETIYQYPEGDFCYGNFKLISIKYNCADYE